MEAEKADRDERREKSERAEAELAEKLEKLEKAERAEATKKANSRKPYYMQEEEGPDEPWMIPGSKMNRDQRNAHREKIKKVEEKKEKARREL